MARLLALTPEVREALANLRKHAEANVVDARRMIRMVQGKEPPIGDDPAHALNVPVGFRVVFSIEDHGRRVMRHLSVSIMGGSAGKTPNPAAVALLAKELGFTVGDDLQFTQQQYVFPSPTYGWAVPNVVETYDG